MHESRSTRSVVDTLVAIARRWRVVLPFAVVTPLVAYHITSSQPVSHVSSADVLLTRQGFVISRISDPTYWYPDRALLTQAQLARLPEIAQRVVDAAALADRGRYGFLAQSWVVSGGATNVMTFFVRDRDPALAARLANTYAEQYIAYRRDLETRSYRRALVLVTGQLERARAQELDPSTYEHLVRSQQQLQTALATVEANTMLVGPAVESRIVAGAPMDAALRALIVALATGLGIAALVALLDPRASSPTVVSEQLGLPIVGRIPRRRAAARTRDLALMRRRGSEEGEAIHALRATLELDPGGPLTGTVLVTSALTGEGRSTTAANLAIALAQTGHRVAVVDLDFRRPSLARLFGVPPTPGIQDVLRRTATLDDALRTVALDRSHTERGPGTTPSLSLRLAPAGDQVQPEALELAAGPNLYETLASLRELADIVLLDGPPLLEHGNALALSQHADALLLVASMRRYRSSYGREVARLLAFTPARRLGLVVVGDSYEVAALPRLFSVRPARSFGVFGRA